MRPAGGGCRERGGLRSGARAGRDLVCSARPLLWSAERARALAAVWCAAGGGRQRMGSLWDPGHREGTPSVHRRPGARRSLSGRRAGRPRMRTNREALGEIPRASRQRVPAREGRAPPPACEAPRAPRPRCELARGAFQSRRQGQLAIAQLCGRQSGSNTTNTTGITLTMPRTCPTPALPSPTYLAKCSARASVAAHSALSSSPLASSLDRSVTTPPATRADMAHPPPPNMFAGGSAPAVSARPARQYRAHRRRQEAL